MKTRTLYTFCFVISMAISHTLVAGPKSYTAKASLGDEPNSSWYDGKIKRDIWLNPSLIAEFNPAPVDNVLNKSLSASATPTGKENAHVRFWRIDPNRTTKTAGQLTRNLPAGKYSPVLHDGQFENTRKRALPGNVIVHLSPDWDSEQVNEWLKNQSLEVIRPLNFGPNIFLVKTEPGLASLEKANALYQGGEVIAAYPDWWVEVHTR